MAKADKNAWGAAHKAARKLLGQQEKDYKYKPLGSIWYEISAQLRQHGDTVDLGKTQGMWTSESQQRHLMHAILHEAGFKRDGDGEVYHWPQSKKADDGKGKAEAKAKDDGKAETKTKDDGKGKAENKDDGRGKAEGKSKKKKED